MSISLTERAATHVKQYLDDNDGPDSLRVAVKPTGCSGFMYVVEMVDQIQDSDQVFESLGVKLVIDPQSFDLLKGTEVDYSREGLNEGFKFNNPNVKQTCGCGESFSIEE